MIARLHWGCVASEAIGTPGTWFALWPEPVDHDLCFAAAGFDAFADSDEAWGTDFERLAERLLVTLTEIAGPPAETVPAMRVRRWPVAGKQPTPLAYLTLAAMDDQWPACRLELGSPVRGVIATGNGHPIFWIWLAAELAARWHEYLHRVAARLPVSETALRWSHLR